MCRVKCQSPGFDFSYLDDDALILDQQSVLAQPSGVWRAFGRPMFPSSGRDHAYYRPLVTASYALDAQWSGARALGYRLTNILLHALAAGLLFLMLHGSATRAARGACAQPGLPPGPAEPGGGAAGARPDRPGFGEAMMRE